MKAVLFIIGLFSCSLDLLGQQSKDEFKVMIDSAISLKYGPLSAMVKDENAASYFGNLYLLNEQNEPLNYLEASSKYNFKFISVYDERSLKVIKKGIRAWKVFTILNGNRLTINIVDFYITYKNRNYNFANGGGAKTIFEYSCDENKWVLISFQNRGI